MSSISYFVLISRSSHPEVFCKKGVLRNFAKFTGKHLRQRLFFNKVAGLRPAFLLKKRLWQRFFPVNFVKFLRTPFFMERFWWLLLNHFLYSLKTSENQFLRFSKVFRMYRKRALTYCVLRKISITLINNLGRGHL